MRAHARKMEEGEGFEPPEDVESPSDYKSATINRSVSPP